MIKAQDLVGKFWYSYNEKWGYIYGMKHVLWTQARQDNYVKAYKGKDELRQRSCIYGGKWVGHIVTDCSGLFAYWFEQLGGAIAHGSNSMYDRYCSAKGSLKNGKKSNGLALKPGTAVFTTGSDGRHGHVGLYVGDGKVIEAKGAVEGVTTSKVTESRWKCWGELKGVEYEEGTPAEDPAQEDEPVSEPTLRKGAKNKYVKELQQLLMDRGYDLGKWGADGDFGAQTEKAVKQFQKDWGLKDDGIVGQATWAKLKEAPEHRTYTVIIRNLTAEQRTKLLKEYPNAESKEE